MAHRYNDIYRDTVIPKLKERFGYTNINAIPKIEKITANIGVGAATKNAKLLEGAQAELVIIIGQKPKVCKAKKSISNFGLRQGMSVGVSTTLRGDRMWDFFDRLVNIAIPRIRDFRGLNPDSFDGRGNYTLGVTEQIIFPEINYDMVEQIRGMNITITTTAKTDEEAKELLLAFGFPFKRPE
jgi:large subunit ribosomal protein L5